MQATEILCALHTAGQAWVAAGRPCGDALDAALSSAEAEYHPMADYIILRARLTPEQHAEWSRINRSFDPEESTT
jgi:hypothetical protein